jgi:uncharacterized membrane protein YcaP (DUF421 family)
MDSIIRAVVVYLMLLIIFRIAGKRTLSETTTFDLVLTLIISEAIQQAMVDEDNSLTNGLLLVLGLIGFDILMSIAKQRWRSFAKLVEGTSVVIVEDFKKHKKYMEEERVDDTEILQAARDKFGIKTFDEIAYAVVEPTGDITIIPKKGAGA